jgi:aspartyl-tRNA(Asn)/glutamyl-tRNA(Gln) amidotransferase subunit C
VARFFDALDPGHMSISEQDLARVAELARIRLDAATVAEVTRRIGNILGMIDSMQAIDTREVVPMAHPLETMQRLREDAVSEGNRRADFLRIAPLSEDGLYLVPRVID